MNEYLKEELNELEYFTEEERTGFRIDGLETLTWAFKKLASINSELEEKTNVANAERLKIDEWLKKASQPLEHSKEFFEYKIKEYHESILRDNPDKKSISTPYGKVKSVTTKEQPVMCNEDELLLFARGSYVDLVEVKEKVKWAELKKKLHIKEVNEQILIVDDMGEIVPGVEVKPKTTNFKVEVSK